ncbi:MAG TPA: hypothetical protein ENN21_03975 [Spirochaetes bacterium]|nr:hypothetical protein [Spirochaetota bacterium]
MTAFFDQASPGKTVKHKKAVFDLPIQYYRDDFFGLFFSAELAKLSALMPSPNLHPVRVGKRKAVIGIAAFNYIDTTIGPYGEVGIVVPVVYGKKPLPWVPLLREARHPGFGMLVLHLPVTTLKARDGGRGVWGYPKFTADMEFTITPEFMRCRLSERKKCIIDMKVSRAGPLRRSTLPLVTYTVKENRLIRTVIPQTGVFRDRLFPREYAFEAGDHPVAEELLGLGISGRPFLSRCAAERAAILPAGEEIEEGAAALDGYRGAEKEGGLKVLYQP